MDIGLQKIGRQKNLGVGNVQNLLHQLPVGDDSCTIGALPFAHKKHGSDPVQSCPF